MGRRYAAFREVSPPTPILNKNLTSYTDLRYELSEILGNGARFPNFLNDLRRAPGHRVDFLRNISRTGHVIQMGKYANAESTTRIASAEGAGICLILAPQYFHGPPSLFRTNQERCVADPWKYYPVSSYWIALSAAWIC